MIGEDGLRDELIRVLSSDEWMERHFGIVAHAHDVADAVLPTVQAHIDAAREQVAEQIAQEIEAEYVDSPWIRTAIDIARQHAKGDGDA